MRRKQIIIRAAVILAVVLLLCTGLSGTVYHLMLPQVKTALPTNGALFEKNEYIGEIGYINTEDITAEMPWEIKSVHVSRGMQVKAGDLLMTVDTTDADIEREQLALQVKQAKAQVAASYGLAREQAQIDWKRAERALQKHDRTYPHGGVVTAKCDGRVVEVNCRANTSSTGTLIRIETADSLVSVQWDMEAAVAKRLELGSAVDCSIVDGAENAYLGKTGIRMLEETATGYTAQVEVKTGTLSANAQALITVEIQSEPYAVIVPRSAVKHMQTGDLVYVVSKESGLFGQAYSCRPVNVQVLEQNALYAAVDLQLEKDEQVVVYTSKTLSDQTEVMVMG